MATKRKWYQKKTNWAIAVGIATSLLMSVPAGTTLLGGLTAGAAVHILGTVAGALGIYGVADRAGKRPEQDK